MALQSVDQQKGRKQSLASSVALLESPEHRTHDLWLSGGELCLTVAFDKSSSGFPPEPRHLASLNSTIQDLVRATKAVIYQAEHGAGAYEWLMQPLEGLSDAIMLLSTLAEAVHGELHPEADAS